jgi:hypothetical protein
MEEGLYVYGDGHFSIQVVVCSNGQMIRRKRIEIFLD